MSNEWVTESLHAHYAQRLRVDEMLYDSNTEHQRLKVFQNGQFGRILTLDDVVQTTEGDNFIYHEMLTHVPILAHGNAKRVLIIGGGDGGMAREALRHASVEHVTMVEIDGGVVDFSKQYLPMLSNGAFDDPRLNLVINDGALFMKENTGKFDVIIVDSTDPIGPGEVLFTDTFYGHAARSLTEDGIIVTQNGVPFMQGDELTGTLHAFQALFADASCYLATVPTYAGGPMAFGWGSHSDKARNVTLGDLETRFAAAGIDTGYYNPEVHKGAFALPNYVKKLFP
ncbi:polyamine aminopropyltransferase [Leisingera thetidis]|uniref:polyamine aminopropyltransferase n=1 Tax=Leisingera thetidis TaxID=2930199 RepID=UPI0021F7052F|nr:polyamine aminopropyltransferase [Leisingera thetidis]